ncbi:MAG: hypothetical protein K5989_08235 [Lachnospiraceae bacterium]|nr:hypothetical protein [Lachnospiraceae bacterium]
MSDEIKEMSEEELGDVSGGKKDYYNHDDFNDVITVHEHLKTTSHTKCPYCGNKDTWDRPHVCVFNWDRVYPGRECPKCGKLWLTGNALHR